MRKLSTTLLLCLMTVMGWSQVTSDLDLCLRDEQTGEWLIGLFDDFAVYNCEYWNYAETGKDHVILVNGCERLDVRLKKNTTIINGKKHKTSVLTSTFLPDYPTKDLTSFSDQLESKERDATIRIFCRRRNEGMPFNIYYQPIFGESYSDPEWKLDSLGRIEKSLPIICETTFNVIGFPTYDIIHGTGELSNWHGWLHFSLKPGERVMVFIDDENKRVYAMGAGARLTNEMAAYYFPNESVDYELRKRISIEDYLKLSDEIYSKNVQKYNDIIATHPNLSKRYQSFMSNELQFKMVSGITQLMFYHQNDSLRPVFAKYMTNEVWYPNIPFSVGSEIQYVYSQYASYIERSTNPTIQLEDIIVWAVNQGTITMNDELREILDGVKILQDSVKVLSDAGRQEELPSFYERHQDFSERAEKVFEKYDLVSIANNMTMDQFVERHIGILDTMNISQRNREILIAQYLYDFLEEIGEPYSTEKLDLLRKKVHEPYLLNQILQKNNEFIAIAESAKTKSSSSFMNNEPLKDLTDGEELLQKIIEPYHGSYIYIDIWGTWCGPCKEEMLHVDELKEELKDKDVVYLYLCNRSSDESWRNNIERYNLDGEHCIHYNLPDAQQHAIEQFIGINGYPTYKLVTPNGQLLPGEAPRPSTAKAVRMMIEELEK